MSQLNTAFLFPDRPTYPAFPRSVESGLLTLVLRGKDAIFGASEAAGFALEVEDLVSLHIVGDGPYAAVTAALSAAGGGFQASKEG